MRRAMWATKVLDIYGCGLCARKVLPAVVVALLLGACPRPSAPDAGAEVPELDAGEADYCARHDWIPLEEHQVLCGPREVRP